MARGRKGAGSSRSSRGGGGNRSSSTQLHLTNMFKSISSGSHINAISGTVLNDSTNQITPVELDEVVLSEKMNGQHERVNSEDPPDAKRPRLGDACEESTDGDMKVDSNIGETGDDAVIITEVAPKPYRSIRRCRHCGQWLDDIVDFTGDSPSANDEVVSLTDPRLSLFGGADDCVDGGGAWDERPQNKITQFSVYCPDGHLCAFDSGLVERNVELYFSGYVKPLYAEDPSDVDGLATKRMGPIDEWWLAGFDGGENVIIAFATVYGDYILMEPALQYAPLMNAAKEKVHLTKAVIEYLADEDGRDGEEATYADLLDRLTESSAPKGCCYSEEALHRHAQFIVEQIQFYDEENDTVFLGQACIRILIELAGVNLEKAAAAAGDRGRRIRVTGTAKAKVKGAKSQSTPGAQQHTKATVTPLVRDVFDLMFNEQLASDTNAKKKLRIGEDASASDDEGEGKKTAEARKGTDKPQHRVGHQKRSTVELVGLAFTKKGSRSYYKEARLNDKLLTLGGSVRVQSDDPAIPFYVARVVSIWKGSTTSAETMIHAAFFYRGPDTVLGEASDMQELFPVDECEDLELCACLEVVEVVCKPVPQDWRKRGGLADTWRPPCDGFFVQKRYLPDLGRFEDPLEGDFDLKSLSCVERPNQCPVCTRQKAKENEDVAMVEGEATKKDPDGTVYYSTLRYRGENFQVGSSVYLPPGTVRLDEKLPAKMKLASSGTSADRQRLYDEVLYPEKYRKAGGSGAVKGSNEDTPDPYQIGRIRSIFARGGGEARVTLTMFYRPDDRRDTTSDQSDHPSSKDLCELFLSEEERTVRVTGNVVGRCWVIHADDLDGVLSLDDYFIGGPDRFYYREYYSATCGSSFPVTPDCSSPDLAEFRVWHEKWSRSAASHRLSALDVFAGCGGLSAGMHESGLAETKWAIERCPAAAGAFQLNNPGCEVFSEDCNLILKLAMQGQSTNSRGQSIPQRGEVDMVCGGPPCQGFSGMNRFNWREYSTFKNSLVASYLSYCDFYRPRYFLLENVRNFVSFKRSMVLRLTLCCLLRMGYQIAFGVLQAGSYGVPQTRRRCIILAAAPGEKLPQFPAPIHTFAPRALSLCVQVGESRIECPFPRWRMAGAPLRSMTVWDALSDLPCVENGAKEEVIRYEVDEDRLSHYQRLMRQACDVEDRRLLRDHICKEMGALVVARIERIPRESGSDWRDLPNMSVRLNDGSVSKLLRYTHPLRTGNAAGQTGPNGALRGVCTCAEGKGKKCDPSCRQFDTLVPWCLPHTGDRHNNWAGLYGRLAWAGHFSTTITNPEPMGKQGRVLHPTQNRVVSVRECARSQGFPDHYRFVGNTLDKHRQIGNAVPPPLARAIGREMLKAVLSNDVN